MEGVLYFGSSADVKSATAILEDYHKRQENFAANSSTRMIQISVVICTYNRAHVLVKALKSLVQQSLDKNLYEIIVVDNASMDNTSEVVQEFQVRHPEDNIILVRESHLGAGYARNTGIRNAKGNVVSFMDDDAQASRDWLELTHRCFEKVQPHSMGLGGRIFPCYESPKPKWFKDEYEIRTWGNGPRLLNPGEAFSGSNMAFRKAILEKYGSFDTRVQISGDYLMIGEDTILFEKIWEHKGDAKFYYSPQLVVFHEVPLYKMTLSYQLKRAFVTGQSWSLRHGTKSLSGQIIAILDALVVLVRLSFLALFHIAESSAFHHWVIERIRPIVIEIGRLVGCFGIIIPVRQRQR